MTISYPYYGDERPITTPDEVTCRHEGATETPQFGAGHYTCPQCRMGFYEGTAGDTRLAEPLYSLHLTYAQLLDLANIVQFAEAVMRIAPNSITSSVGEQVVKVANQAFEAEWGQA